MVCCTHLHVILVIFSIEVEHSAMTDPTGQGDNNTANAKPEEDNRNCLSSSKAE
jgi:hypothetical protein